MIGQRIIVGECSAHLHSPDRWACVCRYKDLECVITGVDDHAPIVVDAKILDKEGGIRLYLSEFMFVDPLLQRVV